MNKENLLEQNNLNRVSIRFNGIEFIGVSVKSARPKNSQESIELLREILGFMESPTVEDVELI